MKLSSFAFFWAFFLSIFFMSPAAMACPMHENCQCESCNCETCQSETCDCEACQCGMSKHESSGEDSAPCACEKCAGKEANSVDGLNKDESSKKGQCKLSQKAADSEGKSSAAEESFAPDWLKEIRVGLLRHDVNIPDITNQREQDGLDINAEAIFAAPDALWWLGKPHPHFGVNINTEGDTSHLYTGLTWDHEFASGPFVAGFFGLALHDGLLDLPKDDPDLNRKKLLGTRVLFHMGAELGYRVATHHGISLYWAHLSNGNIFTDGYNRGLDNVGVRYGYQF